jgi:DNA-binding response OmpR family regulator
VGLSGRNLELEGFAVVLVSHCDEVLDQIRHVVCDAILLDYHLGGADGMACLRALQERYARLPPVVFMTADIFI